MRRPKFLYFDLGMVLVTFSIERMCRQMAQLCGIADEQVRQSLFADGLHERYEVGEVSTAEYFEHFCRTTGTRCDLGALRTAAGDIFELNRPMLPVVCQLAAAGWPLGILSNTCECHWQYLWERYRFLRSFRVQALSYEIRALKPQAAIFRTAAELAGVDPQQVFFTDDIAGHVAGARAAGFDAVQYTSTPQLVAELRNRGVEFNY